MGETVPPLHHLHDAALDEFRRIQLVDALAAKFDRALGHVAALGPEQIRNRFQRRRFAGAVGAEQGDDLAFMHFERHALQHEDHVIVNDLDIVDREQSARRIWVGDGDRQVTFEQSRGVMFFSFAYFLAASSTIGRSSLLLPSIQSDT